MPMSPEKRKFYTFRNWSIYQVNGMIKMLKMMQTKAHDFGNSEICDTAHEMYYALEHLQDLHDELSRLTFQEE